jgi:uncharacterized protein YciI
MAAKYPHGDALVPERFDEHTVVFLVRPPDAPVLTEEQADELQAAHLTYLRDLRRRGVLVANGPLIEQTDPRIRGISLYALPLADALELANADPAVRAHRLVIEGARWLTADGDVAFGSTESLPTSA